MSKITRISAVLALMVAVVSGCKSNSNYGGDCGCGAPGAVAPGVAGGAPVTTHAGPVGMTSPMTGGTMGGAMGGAMPTGPSTFAPSGQGVSGGQFGGR